MKHTMRRSVGKVALVLGVLALCATFTGLLFKDNRAAKRTSLLSESGLAHAAEKADPTASAKAFLEAYKVFSHPRCVNCHPAGDRPLQGDRQVIHSMHIVRGTDGLGKNGVWCSACHQDHNLPGPHMPPGSPGWQLPDADLPMVFEGRTPRQLCQQLKDAAQNGHRSPEELVEHVRDTPIVIWGWHPGEGRTPAPLSHEEFTELLTEWVEKGQACPE
jgi:mono/diheme cytochrome c family protein